MRKPRALSGSSPLARGGRGSRVAKHRRRRLIPARAGRTALRSRCRSPRQAHPRSRGADHYRLADTTAATGSSPLARGGRACDGDELVELGLIPARAGRTPRNARSASVTPAHPRSRGADPRCFRLGLSCSWLIPARAGRTSRSTRSAQSTEAHPRSRGADVQAILESRWAAGSSPLARGGPPEPQARLGRAGLIPARAGRTRSTHVRPRAAPAHPRSRGADVWRYWRNPDESGSSPLARGGRRGRGGALPRVGLIPARAGRTRQWRGWTQRTPAHPRSRGADRRGTLERHKRQGSSPLARGGRPAVSRERDRRGLIPARAGRTHPPVRASSRSWAHPRSRGADTPRRSSASHDAGSSPLARGGRGPLGP